MLCPADSCTCAPEPQEIYVCFIFTYHIVQRAILALSTSGILFISAVFFNLTFNAQSYTLSYTYLLATPTLFDAQDLILRQSTIYLLDHPTTPKRYKHSPMTQIECDFALKHSFQIFVTVLLLGTMC